MRRINRVAADRPARADARVTRINVSLATCFRLACNAQSPHRSESFTLCKLLYPFRWSKIGSDAHVMLGEDQHARLALRTSRSLNFPSTLTVSTSGTVNADSSRHQRLVAVWGSPSCKRPAACQRSAAATPHAMSAARDSDEDSAPGPSPHRCNARVEDLIQVCSSVVLPHVYTQPAWAHCKACLSCVPSQSIT